jgi:pyrroline-5-carboxylate reductase
MGTHAREGPVVLLGCGRLGSAIVEGWLATETVVPADLIILTRSGAPAAEAALRRGARVNPASDALNDPRALILAVKPAQWRVAVQPLLGVIGYPGITVSVMAGVRSEEISALVPGAMARVMPTTAVSHARGVAALWAQFDHWREAARALFARIADVVDLEDECQIDAATATAGSAPAFIHAFVQALARAGEAEGLSPDAAARLARGALRSAGAGAETGEALETLIARIASPGGTTQAGLDAMAASGELDRAATAAVRAAIQRARSFQGLSG